MNEEYIVVKLLTGEQLLGILEYENSDEIVIKYPMLVRIFSSINDNGMPIEKVTASPWCGFAAERVFRLNRAGIMFMNSMHDLVIPQYLEMVDTYEKEVLVRRDEDGFLHVVEEDEHLTVEDIKESVNALTDLIRSKMSIAEEETETTSIYFPGNDTIN